MADPAAPVYDPQTPQNTAPAAPGAAPTGEPAPPSYDIQAALDALKGPDDPRQVMIDKFTQLYEQLWGVAPEAKMIERAVDSGMNIFEFELEQRASPAYSNTVSYRGDFAGRANILARIFGMGRQ